MMVFPQLSPASRSPARPPVIRTPFRGSSTADSMSYATAGIPIGSAPQGNSRRFIVAAICAFDGTDISNSTLSLSGDALTKIIDVNVTSNALSWYSSLHWREFTDTDTTKDLSLVYSNTVRGSATHIFSVITGAAGMSLFATSTHTSGSGGTVGSLLCPAGGMAFASVATRNSTGTFDATQGEHNIGPLNWNGIAPSDLDTNEHVLSYGAIAPVGGRVVCHPDVAPVEAMSMTMVSFRVN